MTMCWLLRLLKGRTSTDREIMRHIMVLPKVVPSTGQTHHRSHHSARIVTETFMRRSLRFWATSFATLIWISALCPAVLPAWAQESSEIAEQAQNPIANLISVPFSAVFVGSSCFSPKDLQEVLAVLGTLNQLALRAETVSYPRKAFSFLSRAPMSGFFSAQRLRRSRSRTRRVSFCFRSLP